MTRNAATALILLALATTTQADSTARRRAVRAPAPQCSFSLAPAYGTPVTGGGLEDGAIHVTASPASCTSWSAYSLTDWVTVTRAGNTALVDVAPNPTSTSRTATLLIAGLRHELIQDAALPVTPPSDGNLLKNPGFDSGLTFWGFQDRFPNGPGTAAWSSFDSANHPSSGSIRLRNTRPDGGNHTFQQLQCVAVEASEVYEYGGTFFATSTSAGSAVFAVVEYADEGCDVAAVLTENQTPRIDTPGTWQTETYVKRMGPTSRSAFVVIGSRAVVPGTFEVHIDNVFLKKR